MLYPPRCNVLSPSKQFEQSESQVPTKLSPARRERLMNIKKREDLKDVLTKKLKKKYFLEGDQASNTEGVSKNTVEKSSIADAQRKDAVVANEVNKFISNPDAAVTSNNLNRLDRRVQKKLSTELPASFKAPSAVSEVSSYSRKSLRSHGCASELGVISEISTDSCKRATEKCSPCLHSTSNLKTSRSATCGNNQMLNRYNWNRLDEYAAYLHEQDALRQKLGEAKNQQYMREDLDKQIFDKRVRKERLKDEDKKYHANQLVELNEWKIYEQKINEEKKTKAQRENRDRDAQVAYERKKKEDEKEKSRKEDRRLLEKINREMAQEKRRILGRKAAQRAAMDQIMIDNAVEREMREKEKEKQSQLDIEAMEEYYRVLDHQDAVRKEEMESRAQRQRALIDTMKETVIKESNENADAHQDRAEKQRQEAEKRFIEKEQIKQERLQEMKIKTQEYLFHQMAEKAKRKEHDKELKDLQAKILENDSEEYRQNELRREEARRIQNLEHKKELNEQIANKQKKWLSGESKYAMTPVEMKINRQLLDVVDKTLTEREEDAVTKPPRNFENDTASDMHFDEVGD